MQKLRNCGRALLALRRRLPWRVRLLLAEWAGRRAQRLTDKSMTWTARAEWLVRSDDA